MPDKYEFRRFADNLNHPWFNDIRRDFKKLLSSPNRFLLLMLCIILMNIDEETFFEQGPDWKYDDDSNQPNEWMDNIKMDGIVLYEKTALVELNNEKHYRKQCKEIPIFQYFGAEKKNLFHTQLMIGVMFGFAMNCRIPILFSFISIIIRSGFSFKPKIIPIFIDKKYFNNRIPFGSSYKLLNNSELDYFRIDNLQSMSDESSSDDDDDDSVEHSVHGELLFAGQ